MLYEVKIYDGTGNLMNIITRQELEKRSLEYTRTQFTERDKEHVMSLEDEEETSAMTSFYS